MSGVYRGFGKQAFVILIALVGYLDLKATGLSRAMVTADTLIIDGDTIFIERQEGMLLSDSTGLTEPDPARFKRPPLRIWNAAFAAGFNASFSSWESLTSDFESLDEFLGRKTATKLNPILMAEFGGRFASIRTPGGMFELSVNTGIAMNQVVSSYTAVSDATQLLRDSVLSFGTESDELFVTYFSVTNPPDIGEVDTAYIELQTAELRLSTIDVPLKLRVTLQPNGSVTRLFLETGVIRRIITGTSFSDNLIMLNNRGEFHPFTATDFNTKRMLVPHFAVGAERRIPMGSAIHQKYFSIGALLAASLPGLTWNSSADLSLDVGSVSLTAFTRFFF